VQSCDSGLFCCGRGFDCCQNSNMTFTLPPATVVRTIAIDNKDASPTSSPSISPSPTVSKSRDSNSVAVGAGVGVGVGVVAIVTAAGLLLWFRRRRLRGPDARADGQRYDRELDTTSQSAKYGSGPTSDTTQLKPSTAQTWTSATPSEPQEMEHTQRYEMSEILPAGKRHSAVVEQRSELE